MAFAYSVTLDIGAQLPDLAQKAAAREYKTSVAVIGQFTVRRVPVNERPVVHELSSDDLETGSGSIRRRYVPVGDHLVTFSNRDAGVSARVGRNIDVGRHSL